MRSFWLHGMLGLRCFGPLSAIERCDLAKSIRRMPARSNAQYRLAASPTHTHKVKGMGGDIAIFGAALAWHIIAHHPRSSHSYLYQSYQGWWRYSLSACKCAGDGHQMYIPTIFASGQQGIQAATALLLIVHDAIMSTESRACMRIFMHGLDCITNLSFIHQDGGIPGCMYLVFSCL